MLPDSRLKVRIRPSGWRVRLTYVLIAALSAVSMLLIAKGHSWLLPFILTLLGAVFFSLNQAQLDDILAVDETGAGQWSADQACCQILPDSLLTPYLLALHLMPVPDTAVSARWYLVFSDQLSVRGWRRLRRVILNVRH